jgi:two-component system NtrC family response regulator
MRCEHQRRNADESGPLVRERVLIVDANESNRQRLQACLSGEYEVRSAASTADSESLIRRFRPHLVIEQIEDAPEAFAEAAADAGRCEGMVGSCDAMRAVFSIARRVARTDVGVLLVGECGTGKEAMARAIHRLSARRARPFVTLCIGALPSERLETEIFGRENGSSGALPGAIEQADGGTLFLDGAGRIPAAFQASLLRFLRDGRYRRVDGRRSIPADVRLIAAADHPLADDIEGGRLHRKLFYRLGVVAVDLPALRDRGEDIGILARALLCRYSKEHHRKITGFTRGAVRAMMNHDWPGNVAEMENRVRRAMIVARGRLVSAGDLGLDGERVAAARTLSEARDELERAMVTRALRSSVGNISRAARSIGVSRPTMYDLIRKYELDVAGFKTPTEA